MKLPLKNKKGFTLIELVLYVGVTSIMLLVIVVFLANLLQSRIKNQTIAEVEQQGIQVMQIITQTTRNAENITAPLIGTSASSLTLDVLAGANDPTVFDLFEGTVRIAEGNSSAVSLTNSRVVVSNLIFQNLSRADTSGIIRIQFTLTHINPENRNEYNYQKIFIGSATLRRL